MSVTRDLNFEWECRWDRCNNYFVAWLGLLPLQVRPTSYCRGLKAILFRSIASFAYI